MRGLVEPLTRPADFEARDFSLRQLSHLIRALVEINCYIELQPVGSEGRQLAEHARRDLGRASQALVEAE